MPLASCSSVAARRGLWATFDLQRETSSSRLLERKLRILQYRSSRQTAAQSSHPLYTCPQENCRCGVAHTWNVLTSKSFAAGYRWRSGFCAKLCVVPVVPRFAPDRFREFVGKRGRSSPTSLPLAPTSWMMDFICEDPHHYVAQVKRIGVPMCKCRWC